MSFWDDAFLNSQLSRQTSIFGLKLWVVIGICAGASVVLFLFLLSLCCTIASLRRLRPRSPALLLPTTSFSRKPLKLLLHDSTTPPVSKEILEIVVKPPNNSDAAAAHRSTEHHPLPPPPIPMQPSPTSSAPASGGESRGPSPRGTGPPEVSHLGWGHWYTLRELELATDHFAHQNVIGEGGYGIVYRGLLPDNTVVAVKNLLNNRGQAEKEFKVEVEVIGRVRHKNLVRLLGYCAEGAHRMLVYEYVDNGNLERWLRRDAGEVSPLTWNIRMNIILGTAKGLAYLHEGLEPKVVHRDVKSSNILIDQHWNAKVSDFGLAKLLCSERTYVTTRVMGTFGYVAPEYASTGMLNERSDVYSLGVLIMEIISGRSPVDYSRPPGEVNLVDWLKAMVGERKSEQVVDPKMPEEPSPKALKRALLVALRCVDPDAQKRPKIGHVIHMLEADDFIIREDRKVGRESVAKPLDVYNTGEEERTAKPNNQKGWR